MTTITAIIEMVQSGNCDAAKQALTTLRQQRWEEAVCLHLEEEFIDDLCWIGHPEDVFYTWESEMSGQVVGVTAHYRGNVYKRGSVAVTKLEEV